MQHEGISFKTDHIYVEIEFRTTLRKRSVQVLRWAHKSLLLWLEAISVSPKKGQLPNTN